jgi:HSP20 family protein
MARDRIKFVSFFLSAAPVREATWRPDADVYRTAYGWLVKFNLAGVRPEDVELTARGRVLTVRGTRRDDCSEGNCRHHQLEIEYGRFERHLELPVDLGAARIQAEQRLGMLLVHVQTEASS